MIDDKQPVFVDAEKATNLIAKYSGSEKRLILLDYDGTLTPLMPLPEQAAPAEQVLKLLQELAKDPRNSVYIISGREYKVLGEWLGHLPLSLVAEHGAWFKQSGADWTTAAGIDSKWMAPVTRILERFAAQCDGAFVELKSYSVAWHYRNADQDCVEGIFNTLIEELDQLTSSLTISVIQGNKVVEVKNKSVHKGAAVEKILNTGDFDFIFACGDDTTDEDMFRQLSTQTNAITVKVGSLETSAKFNVQAPADILELLAGFIS